MSDQQRPDAVGYAGNPVVRTPNLDMLAKDAVVFNNAYTPSPVCVPARPCITAGKLPMTAGVLRFGEDIPPHSTTFPLRFSQYAYHTVVCGKLHHEGWDQNQGWNMRVGLDNPISSKYIDGFRQEEADRYKGPRTWWPWDKEVRKSGPGKSPYLFRDQYATDGACAVLEEALASPFYDQTIRRPIFLKHSLTQPHYPYVCDEELFTYYLNRVTPYLDEFRETHPMLRENTFTVGEDRDLTEREVLKATAAYYGMTEKMDAMFGQVLDKMRHLGEDLDDWIIVFCSDHGEMLGEHSAWMKFSYYESSARVPLFIRWPKKFGPRQVDENVNLCDLFATLCDMADIEIPNGLDSRSMIPLMQGDASAWSNETISQLNDSLMIKQDALKYLYWGEATPEVLFDLERDPKELNNVIDDPDYAEALSRFRTRRASLGYGPDADPDYVNAGYSETPS